MAQTQTWETKTNWAMEKLIPRELAKNNKQTINNPRMENKNKNIRIQTIIQGFTKNFEVKTNPGKGRIKPQNFQNLHNKTKCHWDNFYLKENGQQHMKTQ